MTRRSCIVASLTVAAFILSSASDCRAQTPPYTATITYPTTTNPATQVYLASTLTVTGTIKVNSSGYGNPPYPSPTSVGVTVTDKNGNTVTGTGGFSSQQGTTFSFSIAVYLDPNVLVPGPATVVAKGSTGNNGSGVPVYNAGSASVPIILAEKPAPPPPPPG